ncbi:hypothetical protein DFA_07269 [Cavenderia fasciculata]|uniref:Importin subunit alpha n=1 Tax=Cavenderia fasciculata TaxID=261658 RepID=F4PVY5_CACFS|nr:uncharacterized protein DFA_07269 [Cavenderia fasciculata]EGG20149.1 hypothetical protein DFA_07269 [Cavenderia fasciculata]|eukprot:XP_004367132.1 hypothetical protein DFA_07269 [Cavenderia fasciculata]
MNYTNKILTLLNDIKFQERKVWVDHLKVVTEQLQKAFEQKSLVCDEFLIASLADLLIAVFPFSSDPSLNTKCQDIIKLIFEILPSSLHDNAELRDALRIKLLETLAILIVFNVQDANLLKIFSKAEVDAAKESTNPTTKKVEEQLPILVADIYSADYEVTLAATTGLRKLLAIERNPPIKEVVKAGVIPRLIKFLEEKDRYALQFEAAWALTNIASGTSEQTRAVVEHGAIAAMVPLLKSPNSDVREQAVWALGNIAGDGTKCRDLVISHGVIPTFVAILQSSFEQTVSVIRNTTWALQNLVKNKPFPPFEVAKQALPIFAKLIYSQDEEVVVDSCWGLSYITDYPDFQIDYFLSLNIFARILELMNHTSHSIKTPSLRVVGNIASCDDHIAEKILTPGLLSNLSALLNSQKTGLIKESAWTISNFAAGPPSQIQMIIDAKIIPQLITIVATGHEDSKREAAWALVNATSGAQASQSDYLVKAGVVESMAEILKTTSTVAALVKELLKALALLFAKGPNNKKYQERFIKAEGIKLLDQYRDHMDSEITQQAIDIISTLKNNSEHLEALLDTMSIRAE